MKNFVLYNPVRVIFGAGESKDMGRHIEGLGKKAMLVCYEKHDFLAPLLSDVENSLKSRGIEVIPFYAVQANPLLCHIRDAVKICRE